MSVVARHRGANTIAVLVDRIGFLVWRPVSRDADADAFYIGAQYLQNVQLTQVNVQQMPRLV